jgi:serine/threonine protein kinase
VSGVEVPHHLYAAPEVLANGRAGPASDVFSFGVVCFELACQRLASEHISALTQHRQHLVRQGNAGVQEEALQEELAPSQLPPSKLFAIPVPFSTSGSAVHQHQGTASQLSDVQLQTQMKFARLVEQCLALEPSERPTFAELVPQLYEMWHTLVRQVNPNL